MNENKEDIKMSFNIHHRFALCGFSALAFCIALWIYRYNESIASAEYYDSLRAALSEMCIPNTPTFFKMASFDRLNPTVNLNNQSFVVTTDNIDHSHQDKVTTHHYQFAYQTHVAPIRCNVSSFLEIGLGCGMKYGAGASVPLWLSYLPAARVHVMEFDKPCGDAWLAVDAPTGARRGAVHVLERQPGRARGPRARRAARAVRHRRRRRRAHHEAAGS